MTFKLEVSKDETVEAMDAFKQKGDTIRDTCAALGISRSGYYGLKVSKNIEKPVVLKDSELIDKIKSIKNQHP